MFWPSDVATYVASAEPDYLSLELLTSTWAPSSYVNLDQRFIPAFNHINQPSSPKDLKVIVN